MKVAILCPGKMGDVCESTGLFRYALELWGPKHDIHWYVDKEYVQPLEHNPMVTVHLLGDGKQRIREARKEILSECYDAHYRTAPWLNMQHVWTVPLPLIPPMVLGINMKRRTWTPQIWLTKDEEIDVISCMADVPRGIRVMLETASFSHQGDWTDEMTRELIERTDEQAVVFLSSSFGYDEKMKAMGAVRVLPLDGFNYRQLALVYNHCDMFVGVPSGTASVTCASLCRTLPRVEYIEERRCPAGGKRYPDWGTGSMRPCFASPDPQKVLDKAVSIIQTMGGRRKLSRAERKAEARRRRRRAAATGAG